jgi:phosphohistidine phosphatase SixA
MKTVDYWTGRAVGDDDVSLYRPNQEIDQVAWVRIDKAERMLTYAYDRDTLAEAVKERRRTHAVVVLRHAQARSRRTWKADDQLRPLLKVGETESGRVVPLLAAYDVTRVVSSPSTRCLQTVVPYAETTGWEIETRRRLTEEQATEKGVRKVVDELLEDERGSVLCTHRPVLPLVYDALGLRRAQRGDELECAEMLVLHVRKSTIVSVERHRAG